MNKITHRIHLLLMYAIVFILFTSRLEAQDSILNKYGLVVINNKARLQRSIAGSPQKAMVDLKKAIPGLHFDLRYAGTNNFMHQKLYPAISTTYLRKAAADGLLQVQLELVEKGFTLKIFDAYRPYSVTEKMWEPIKDARYAADPKFGSGHNRGIAVDLTIIYTANKKELDMGTGFDNFSDTASHGFSGLSKAVLENRLLLKSAMEKQGFKALNSEWWHYYLPDYTSFELLDLSFKDLKN